MVTWRVLHSVARRLDYIVKLGNNLRDLIEYVVATERYNDESTGVIEKEAPEISTDELVSPFWSF